jgi:ParB-like chromosome segregation protein Spo0J
MREFSIHPAADFFPLLSGEALDSLVADIKEHGLREPILLHEGKILDGRNRYRACEKAGVEPQFREWNGKGSLTALVWSLNDARRHLNESQRAMAGARAIPHLEKEARERQLAGLKQYQAPVPANLPERGTAEDGDKSPQEPKKPKRAKKNAANESRAKAAKAAKVSSRSVASASKVLKEGTPELAHAVEQGKITVSLAEKLTKEDEEFQRAVVEKLETGAVKKPMEAVRLAKKDRIVQQDMIAPSGKFRVFYADPPWKYGNSGSGALAGRGNSWRSIGRHWPSQLSRLS